MKCYTDEFIMYKAEKLAEKKYNEIIRSLETAEKVEVCLDLEVDEESQLFYLSGQYVSRFKECIEEKGELVAYIQSINSINNSNNHTRSIINVYKREEKKDENREDHQEACSQDSEESTD